MIEKISWKIHLFISCVVMDTKNLMLRYRIWKCRKKQEKVRDRIKEAKASCDPSD